MTFTALVCVLLTPRAVFSAFEDTCGGNTSDVDVNDPDDSSPGGDAPCAGPGGGTGGTIGSLPININPLTSNLTPGLLPAPSSFAAGSTLTFTAPAKVTVYGFGWVVNGNPVLVSTLPQGNPIVTFTVAELKAAQQTFSSLVLVFYGQKGAIVSGCDIMALPL